MTGQSRLPNTKADALRWLQSRLKTARILDQVCLTVRDWRADPDREIARVLKAFSPQVLIVRSSAINESSATSSNSGAHLSLANIPSGEPAALRKAIHEVIESYGEDSPGNQVLLQPQLRDVVFSAVISTVDRETGAPYTTCTYSEIAGRTDEITSGSGRALRQYIRWKDSTLPFPTIALEKSFVSVREIEELAATPVEVELSLDSSGNVYVFQARPVIDCSGGNGVSQESITLALQSESAAIARDMRTETRVYGVMPDWNPAELIGIKPAPLAFSLYNHLFAHTTWAEARRDLGYADLCGTPLVRDLCGCPFVDVRASFLSLTPAGLPLELRNRLVDFQLTVLRQHPHLHDKVEFEVVISCHSPGYGKKERKLLENHFTQEDAQILDAALRRLTRRLLRRDRVYSDIRQAESLPPLAIDRCQPLIVRIRQLLQGLENCRANGALPFARLARQAFISVQCLREFVSEGGLQPVEFDTFFAGLRTVASGLNSALDEVRSGKQSRADFLRTYGHLRPGTYDLTSPRYDEAFDAYFAPLLQGIPPAATVEESRPPQLVLSTHTRESLARFLGGLGSELPVDELLRFFKASIEAREQAKLEFTRVLSDALRAIRQLSEDCGIEPDDARFLTLADLCGAVAATREPAESLQTAVAHHKEAHRLTRAVKLPDLITSEMDLEHFISYLQSPNYVTRRRVTGPVIRESQLAGARIEGAIVCVRAADPGHDWIFAHGIGGLVTRYGGTNSHMAVRCAELGLPAVIGCSETDFRRWSGAQLLSLDCGTQTVSVVA